MQFKQDVEVYLLVSRTVARNQTQKIPTEPINDRVVVQPNTWYTCPAGKKAIVKGSATCTSTGAAANTTLQANAIPIKVCLAVGGGTNPWDRDIAPDITFNFEVQLAAGQILNTIQNAGVNAEWEMQAEITESPA